MTVLAEIVYPWWTVRFCSFEMVIKIYKIYKISSLSEGTKVSFLFSRPVQCLPAAAWAKVLCNTQNISSLLAVKGM